MLSVIIPFYNGERWIATLLQSLAASMMQRSYDFSLEIIIVIDSEQTVAIAIEHLAKRCLDLPNICYKIVKNSSNLGVARSRDIGLSFASGEYVTFIDQDDYVSSTYCDTLGAAFHSQADVYLLNGVIRNTLSNQQIPVYYYMFRPSLKRLVYGNSILSPSFWIVRTAFIRENGIHFTLPFNEFRGIDDWYYSLQIFLHQPFVLDLVHAPLIYYCIHDSNFSHNLEMQFDGSIAVLKHLYPYVQGSQTGWILKRIQTFEFSKAFYLHSKKHAILKHPIIFLHFLYHYLCDPNRLIRFVHRSFIGMRIR